MSNLHILIVEDEVVVAMDVADQVTTLGHCVVGTAATGIEALNIAKQSPPDLVLMDIHLQGNIDGIETARQMQAQHAVPIVFLTADADRLTLDRAKETFPYGYLIKPFDARELEIAMEIAHYKFSAERKLWESEERHRMILQTAMDGFWLTDCEGRLLEVNAAYCEMSGYTESELLELSVSDLVFPEESERKPPQISDLIAKKKRRFETRHRRKDWSFFHVEVSALYRDAEGGRLVFFIRDITERKSWDAERAEMEMKSQKLFNEVCRLALRQTSENQLPSESEF